MAFICVNEEVRKQISRESSNRKRIQKLKRKVLDDLPWVYGPRFLVAKHNPGDVPAEYIPPHHLFLTAVSSIDECSSQQVYLGCYCRLSPSEDALRSSIREAFEGVRPPKAFGARLKELIKQKRPDLKCKNFTRKCEIVYQQAGISKSLWYGIVSSSHSSKQKTAFDKATVISLAFALRLNLDETNELLKTTGMILSDDLLEDRVYARCIIEKVYDAEFVNSILQEKGIGKKKFLRLC